MPNYQKMYTTLFNVTTDVIEKLQQAQMETEEIYMNEPDLSISIVSHLKEQKE